MELACLGIAELDEVSGLSTAVPLTVIALVGIAILVFAPVAVYLALVEE